MARYIVTHNVARIATQDELFSAARQVVAGLGPGLEWRNSWWVAETERLICEWEAPDPEAIRSALEGAQDLIPIEAIHEAQWIDPSWYRQS